MSMPHRYLLLLLAFTVSFAWLSPGIARAQADEKAAADLARVRQRYEGQMEQIRSDIDKAIKSKIAAASTPGKVDNEKLKQAEVKGKPEDSTGYKLPAPRPDAYCYGKGIHAQSNGDDEN